MKSKFLKTILSHKNDKVYFKILIFIVRIQGQKNALEVEIHKGLGIHNELRIQNEK